MTKTRIIKYLFVLMLFLGTSISVSAENVLDSFTAKALPSELQLNKKVSYFDLLMKPKQTEELTVLVENRKDTEMELQVSVNQAITNQGGVVEYSGSTQPTSETAPFKITDLVKIKEPRLTLKPHEKKEITLEVTMPDKSFTGILAGGLYLIEVPKEQSDSNIRNILSRVIAIVLRTDKKAVKPEITFNGIQAIHDNQRNALEIDLENTQSEYAYDVSVAYDVKHEGKAFFEGQQERMKIAPNSTFPYTVQIGKEFLAGDYTALVTVKSGDLKWEQELKFKVDKEQVNELNETNISDKEPTPFPWTSVLLGAVLVLFMLLVLFLIRQNKKLAKQVKDQDENE